MKEIPKQDSDTPVQSTEDYDKNLEQMAVTMITKGSIQHKVKDFKTRVYGLLILYLNKAKSPGQLVKALNPLLADIQPADVPKLDTLVRQSLKKSQTVDIADLQTLVDHYQILLLKTARWKDSKRITETFSTLLRSLMDHGHPEQEVKQIVLGLCEKYVYKRGVKIHPQTIQHLIKKFKFCKEALHDNLQKALDNEALREAMKKQVRKMLRWFGKSHEVKIE